MTFKEVFEDVVRYSIPDFPELSVKRIGQDDSFHEDFIMGKNNQPILSCKYWKLYNLNLYDDSRYGLEILRRVVDRKEPKQVYVVGPRNAGIFPHIYFKVTFNNSLEQESPSYGPLFATVHGGRFYTFLGFRKDEEGSFISEKSLQDWINYLQEEIGDLLFLFDIDGIVNLVKDLFTYCSVKTVLDYKKITGGMGV